MKRIVTLMLAVMMVLSMATFAQAEEPVRIICYTSTNAGGFPADLESNYVYQQILDRTGVAFEMIYLDEYEVSLNARIFGGDTWHMASMDSAADLVTYADQECLLPLTDYAEELKVIYRSTATTPTSLPCITKACSTASPLPRPSLTTTI